MTVHIFRQKQVGNGIDTYYLSCQERSITRTYFPVRLLGNVRSSRRCAIWLVRWNLATKKPKKVYNISNFQFRCRLPSWIWPKVYTAYFSEIGKCEAELLTIKQIFSARYSGSEIVASPRQLRVEWAELRVHQIWGEHAWQSQGLPTRILHFR